jgi:hypothetical protein
MSDIFGWNYCGLANYLGRRGDWDCLGYLFGRNADWLLYLPIPNYPERLCHSNYISYRLGDFWRKLVIRGANRWIYTYHSVQHIYQR